MGTNENFEIEYLLPTSLIIDMGFYRINLGKYPLLSTAEFISQKCYFYR